MVERLENAKGYCVGCDSATDPGSMGVFESALFVRLGPTRTDSEPPDPGEVAHGVRRVLSPRFVKQNGGQVQLFRITKPSSTAMCKGIGMENGAIGASKTNADSRL